MSNGIGRKRTLGIAKQSNYLTPATAPSYVIPLLDTARIRPVQNKALNNAALGSSYVNNAVANTNKMANVTLSFKVDEDSFPLFWLQNFSITSTTAPGESAVFIHTLTYNSSNDGSAFTVFLDDDDRTSLKSAGFKLNNINLVIDQGFLRADAEGIGQFPETWTGSNTVTQPNEFVGRNAGFSYGDFDGSTSSETILQANLNHSFNLSGDDVNFAIGSDSLQNLFTGESDFDLAVSALFSSFTGFRSDWVDNESKQAIFSIVDTSRFVEGSVASTRPSITLTYPIAKVTGWEEEGGLGDQIRENVTLKPLDQIGVADAPLKIVVVNSVSSY